MSRLFNGTSDGISTQSTAFFGQLLAPLTLSVWVYPVSLPASVAQVARFNSEKLVFRFNTSGATQVYVKAFDSTFNFAPNGTGPVAGQWAHYAVTYDKVNLSLYLNGTVDTFVALTKEVITSGTDNILIGSSPGSEFNNARIAEVTYWNVALARPDILTLAKGAPVRTVQSSRIVFYMPLIGASPEIDFGGHAMQGTLTGTSVALHPPLSSPVFLQGPQSQWFGQPAAAPGIAAFAFSDTMMPQYQVRTTRVIV